MNVLIIEDNQDIVASIYNYFESLNYTVDAAYNGLTGLHLALTNDYDVVVLDLGLPGIDGIDLCRQLRQDARHLVPVIMLTARDSLEYKIEGFDSGADDYLVKPFALKELAARVKVLSKRANHKQTSQLQIGDLSLNVETHEISRSGKQINLNPTLFRLLTFLMQNPYRVLNREEIERAVWQGWPPDSDALRTHFSNLRQVIDKPFRYPLIYSARFWL